jgi:hypothetical protein
MDEMQRTIMMGLARARVGIFGGKIFRENSIVKVGRPSVEIS